MNLVIDTSVWIECLRGNAATLQDQVQQLLSNENPVSCGIIEHEILRGASPAQRAIIETSFSQLQYEEFNRQDFEAATKIYQDLKSKGRTLNLADLLIAAFCIRRKLVLMSMDSDFKDIPGLERLRPNLP